MRLKKIIGSGLLLAIPLGTILYIFIKLIKMLAIAIAPLASDLGIQKILGELTLTILAVFVLLLIIFFLGLLMQINIVAGFGQKVEEIAFKLFPSLNQVKALASEKMEFSNQSNNWRAAIVYYEDKYNPAYLVEENEKLITVFILKGTTLQDGEILITEKAGVKIIPITPTQLHQFCRQFGKGFLSVIPLND